MSRTFNKWRNKKTVNHKEYAVVNKLADVIVICCGKTPKYKWGKPNRCSQSDRNHKMKKYKKRLLRYFYKNETKKLIEEN